MSRSAAEVLSELVRIVKRIERDAAGVASVLNRPVSGKGSPPVAAPRPS